MKIKIHRGARQIGGSCVEIATDVIRILLDIGLPLEDGTTSRGQKRTNKSQAEEQARKWCDGVDAVFISHYHGDHMGLIGAVPVDTPVYMSAPALRAHILPQVIFAHEQDLKKRNLQPLFRPVEIGDLTIKPYRVDHSAYGAQAFLISDGQSTVFYSGDMRTHGLEASLLKKLPRQVDYMILEGTNILREYDNPIWSEQDVGDRFVESFTANPASIHYVWVSALNIDRLKMLYAACEVTGKTLLVDTFTIHILRTMNKKDLSVPFGDNYPLLRTFCPEYLAAHFVRQHKTGIRRCVASWEISLDEVKVRPEKYVVAVRPRMEPEIDFINALQGVFINSMWQEYENIDRYPDNRTFIESISRYTRRHIHTSGHADRQGLLKIAEHIRPRHIIPIHTETPEEFDKLFADYSVIRLSDGEEFDV